MQIQPKDFIHVVKCLHVFTDALLMEFKSGNAVEVKSDKEEDFSEILNELDGLLEENQILYHEEKYDAKKFSFVAEKRLL